MILHKKEGIKSFLKKDFKSALMHFSLALQKDPDNQELRTYIDLSQLATKRENEAMALFEFYTSSLKNELLEDQKDLERIIDSLYVGSEKMQDIFAKRELDEFILEEDGILYEDFLELVEASGDFRKTFENIMFSTKVIITDREDFIHFLNLLVDNDFIQMALNYLESAVSIFPIDKQLRAVANRVELVSHK